MVLKSNFILFVFITVAVLAIAIGAISHYRILIEKRKANRIRGKRDVNPNYKQWRKKERRNNLIIGAGIIILVLSLFITPHQSSKKVKVQIGSGETDVVINQYIETISAEFGELHPNNCKTKWEIILDENLGAILYGTNESSQDYESTNGNMLLSQDRLSIVERIHALYENNAGLLVTPMYTLEEINKILETQGDEKSNIAEIHKQEVILYAGDIMGRENSICRESVCQAGRAAHEVVNCLCQESEADVREIIFYAALAKEYYEFAIGMPIDDMKSVNRYDEYILYRMGMLFDKLAEVETLIGYREHFLFEAASFYALASDTGMGKNGMSQNHIYNVDFFRGRVLYYLYDIGREGEGECAKECIENFLSVKDEIPTEFRLPGVETSCEYILKRLGSR